MSRPRLSVVVELGTYQVTRRMDLSKTLNAQLQQVSDFAPGEIEFLLVGSQAAAASDLGQGLRLLVLPNSGYYDAKNHGAQAAQGDYVVFWDSDCLPSQGYLRTAFDILEAMPDALGVAGVTRYNGTTWLSRLNSTLSFGYLAGGKDVLGDRTALAHNVAIRKHAFPSSPFGNHSGRSGGDIALTRYAIDAGAPLLLDRRLQVLHEDPSVAPRALLERHLREHFGFAWRRKPCSWYRLLRLALYSSVMSVKHRWTSIRDHGRSFEIGQNQRVQLVLVLIAYALIDALAVGLVGIVPRWRRQWLAYQFGPEVDL